MSEPAKRAGSGPQLPLDGVLVVDTTRMLPGAVAARMFLDQGARLIKIEAPRGGDMMRGAGPLRGGMSVGFAHYFRGAESLPLDLRSEEDREVLRRLITRADVLLESFRPGTLERWGLGLDALRRTHPRLITCSLPGYASTSTDPRTVVGHDLNFTGEAGLLSLLPSAGSEALDVLAQAETPDADTPEIPAIQFADVTAGLLGASAVVSALLRRTRTGEGGHVEQPLASGPLPFMAWAMADAGAGGAHHPGVSNTLLAGKVASYRCYRCGDGRFISVGCLEPKFWIALTQRLGVPALATAGLDPGPKGRAAMREVAQIFATKDLDAWLESLADGTLPIGPVRDVAEALQSDALGASGLMERTPMPDGSTLASPGPAMPSVSATPDRPAPKLGEHAASIRRELGLEESS